MPETVEELIVSELKQRKKSIIWLANLVYVNNRHLYYVLTGKNGEKRKLYPVLQKKIEDALGVEFNPSIPETPPDTSEA